MAGVVDAHREDRGYIVHSDELLSGFLGSDAALISLRLDPLSGSEIVRIFNKKS